MAQPCTSQKQAADLTNGSTLTDGRTDLRTTTKTKKTRLVPDAPPPVDNPYIELPADHDFTAFLAGLTPGKVLKDREVNFSRVERKRARYLVARDRYVFTDRQMEIALQATLRAGREEGKR